jgi:hypothetical protein
MIVVVNSARFISASSLQIAEHHSDYSMNV